MTDEELIEYFKHAILPGTLRLDRATTQHNVANAVATNIESMKENLRDERCRYRLHRIVNAIEHPYDGPEIPRV
jgi:hypothetical protein